MDHTVIPYFSTGVKLYIRVKDRIVADNNIIACEYVGVDLYIVAHFHVVADIGEGTAVNIFSNDGILAEKTRLLNTSLLITNELVVFLEEYRKAGIRIIHQEERRRKFLFWLKVFFYQDRTGVCGIEILFVLGIGEKGDLTFFGILDFCQHVDFLRSFPPYFPAQHDGYLLNGKLHSE